jgi:hypothetical protein
MQDVFYILITVFFGLFVLFLCFLTWRFFKKSKIKKDVNDFDENEREIIYAFCNAKRKQNKVNK